MERHVKERLVGAAVLMAAAIILIPEMLSGPERSDTGQSASNASATAEDGSIKTYTIDLDGSPGSPAVPSVTEEPAPPPEISEAPSTPQREPDAQNDNAPDENNAESQVAAAPTPAPESSLPDAPESRSAQVPESATPAAAESNSGQRERASSPAAADPARALATPPIVPTSRGWAVQLGSFSNRSTAEELSAEFRADRYPAFVMPVKTATATLYRVRIGPVKDRASAEDMLRKVRAKVPAAAVVTHP